jgi:hypothetical protein
MDLAQIHGLEMMELDEEKNTKVKNNKTIKQEGDFKPLWAVMSDENVAYCASSMRNGVKCAKV